MLKEIYFLNVSELSKRIRSGSIDKLLMLKHFIVFSILFYSGFSLPITLSNESTSNEDWVMLVLMFIIQAVINYYGIWYTYQVNEKGDGKDYFYRLFCLALPISIRLALYVVLFTTASAAVLFVLFSGDIEPSGLVVNVLYLVLFGVYTGAFYYMAGKYIRVCSSVS